MENSQTQDVILARPPEPRWFYLLLGFLIFPIGFALGFIYLRKDGLDNKGFATKSIIAGLALPVILILIGIIVLLLS